MPRGTEPLVLQQQPKNVNTLHQDTYRFTIRRLPHVNYFCYSATLPAISINSIHRSTPFRDLPTPGVKLAYDQKLTLIFAVDEDLQNYLEIHDWLIGLGKPDSFDQRKKLVEEQSEIPRIFTGGARRGVPWTDGTLLVNTSQNNLNVEIVFQDLYPVSLSGLTFETRTDKIEPMTATVDFAYSKFAFPDRE